MLTEARDFYQRLMEVQELGSMYDYLAKIILLGPSGTGKYVTIPSPSAEHEVSLTASRSCLLHRFVKNEWKVLSSQTIGVEFASKIIRVGTGARRKRIKLQVRPPAQPSATKLTKPALGHSRHRTLPLSLEILLPWRCRRNISLRHNLP